MKIMFCALMLLASAIAHAQPGSVRINEIMYDDTAGIDVEWVELYNTLNVPVDVSHWVLTDGNTWPVPTSEGAIQISAGVTIPPLGYQVISKQSLIGVPGLVCAEIDPSWLLHDTGDNLALYDGVGFSANLIDGTIAPLQNFPDLCGLNSGNSLEKCNQAAPWSTDPSQWHESTHLYSTSGRYRHCTPGLPNSACASLCGGSLQAPPMLTIPHTAVGSSNVINFPIMNDGVQTICIDSIRTNGNVFTTNVPPVLLEPGGVFDVQVMFAPLYEFDFDGVVTIYHAQADTPKTVVHINALACTPVVSPPPPILHSAGSPNHLYYVIPWDPQNSERTKYAVEVSPDAFQTSWFIEPIPSNPGPQTVYFLGKDWAQRGTGVISGLNPGTNYQARLWARDCFGHEMVGTFAELSTEPAVQFSADPRLTAQVIHPDSLRLR
ncbi:lamin tail domain-containing protein, partial [bacterium]|nr:lamin tail domain-containing protein [bacterium]